MQGSVLLVAICLLISSSPLAFAASNEATVRADGDDNHVAICQLLILVDSVVIFGIEDHLGLVTLPARTSLPEVFAQQLEQAPSARCDIEVGSIRLHLPDAPASFVSGPEVVGAAAPLASPGSISVRSSAESSVSICQRIVLLGVLAVGGSAFGLTEATDGTLVQAQEFDSTQPGSSCRVAVGDVEVDFA